MQNPPLDAGIPPLQAPQGPQHSPTGSCAAGAREPAGLGLPLHQQVQLLPWVPLLHGQAGAPAGRESHRACDQDATCRGPTHLGHSYRLGPSRAATGGPADAWPTPKAACEHKLAQAVVPPPGQQGNEVLSSSKDYKMESQIYFKTVPEVQARSTYQDLMDDPSPSLDLKIQFVQILFIFGQSLIFSQKRSGSAA